jgi:peptidyl-prolyl cis-trans isomerase D
MALMQSLRDSTHIIMIILVLAFIALIGLEWGADITGRGAGGQNVVGTVNGQKILYEEIRTEHEQLREMEREQRGGDIDEFRSRQLLNDVWNRRVEFLLLREQIEKRGISVTDAELLEAIREEPPDFLKQQAIFQTDGRFDRAKYLQALNNPNVQGWEFIEAQYRLMLPQRKLVDRLRAIAHVTDIEVRQAYIEQNEKVRVKYLLFDPNEFANEPVAVTDADIRAYYDQHKKEFEQNARTQIAYVMFPKAPSTADSQRVERQIRDLREQIINGADFEKLARDFSEDPGSASKGGDLGFFRRGDMVAPFEEAAFQTPVGQVAEPVKTQFGWHIIKVEERKQENGEEQVRARHILLKTLVGQETLRNIRQKAEGLLARAKESSLQEAVRSLPDSLTVQDTGYFEERPDGFMPKLGYLMGAGSFALDAKPGDYSEVLENDTGFYVLHLAGRKEKGVQDLAEVRPQLQTQLTREKRMEKAKARGEQVKARLGGGPLDALSEPELSRVVTLDPFARQGFIPGVGQDPAFTGAAFRLTQPGQTSNLVKGERGYYLIQLLERQPIDEAAYEAQKAALKEQLLLQKQSVLYTDWLNELKEKANIENNLGRFFVF